MRSNGPQAVKSISQEGDPTRERSHFSRRRGLIYFLRCTYLKKAGGALAWLGKNGDTAGEPERFFLVMRHEQRTDALVL
jgi:hypothetical protein